METEDLSLQLGPLSAAMPGPLYAQIIAAMKREIGGGRLAPGTMLPSSRALAEKLMVSVITTKRAYDELEREGIIYRRQGLGSFVADGGGARSREAARLAAVAAVAEAARAGMEARLSDDDLLALLRAELHEHRSAKP